MGTGDLAIKLDDWRLHRWASRTTVVQNYCDKYHFVIYIAGRRGVFDNTKNLAQDNVSFKQIKCVWKKGEEVGLPWSILFLTKGCRLSQESKKLI